jgi:hypothetical protein
VGGLESIIFTVKVTPPPLLLSPNSTTRKNRVYYNFKLIYGLITQDSRFSFSVDKTLDVGKPCRKIIPRHKTLPYMEWEGVLWFISKAKKRRSSSTRSTWRARPGEIFTLSLRSACRVTHSPFSARHTSGTIVSLHSSTWMCGPQALSVSKPL